LLLAALFGDLVAHVTTGYRAHFGKQIIKLGLRSAAARSNSFGNAKNLGRL
jgi:hypothetical protein